MGSHRKETKKLKSLMWKPVGRSDWRESRQSKGTEEGAFGFVFREPNHILNSCSIFKPSESNPLIDILMNRNTLSKSPRKPRQSKAGKLSSSRKSIGVPKTPRKSLANHPFVAREPLATNESRSSGSDLKGKTTGMEVSSSVYI